MQKSKNLPKLKIPTHYLFFKCIPNIFHSGKKNTSAAFVSLRRLCKPYNRKHYSTHIAVTQRLFLRHIS